MFGIFKKTKTIVTHSGNFHADDIFGVATLSLALEDSYRLKIIRTRNKKEIENADFVVDVGDQYDEAGNRFDHHQVGRAGVRDNGVPYAAFGLVWKKFGEQVCGDREVAESVERKLVIPVDAIDNGIRISTPIFKDIYEYTIGDVFSAYKRTWKEDPESVDHEFLKMVDFAKNLIRRQIIKARDGREARKMILNFYSNLNDKRLLILPKYYPTDVVIGDIPGVLLLVFPEPGNNNWCLKVTRKEEGSFESEILLPEAWAGRRDAELEHITGIKGAIFCHPGRFFAVAKTKEAAVALAQKALNG